ncbi:MAG: butyryl-CoA:acetate CoA-transferase [Syntrophomonadaceae bacterium]|nr:butyryl-CoA:acetate CoA-transferase [Syntrophomonadaceae bacterium]
MAQYMDLYKEKLRTADEAVKAVKSGDWVAYSHFVMTPVTLDRALAKRVGELTNVNLKTSTGFAGSQAVLADPEQKSFTYHSSFFSHADRQLGDKGLCFHLTGNYSQETVNLYGGYCAAPNVCFLKTTTMDKHGFFNFGTSPSFAYASAELADIVIVEVNSNVPRCLGGSNEKLHISQVDYIVESANEPMLEIPVVKVTPEDEKIAGYIVKEIEDGACLQLGIGGIPNMVGKYIADSDVKDLGGHSEMLADAYVDLYENGKMNGKYKTLDVGKMSFTFAMGSQRLYDFMDDNPACAAYDSGYTNSIMNIAANDKVVSVNNALQVDLYGSVVAGSQGYRHISGSGGQLDFTIGATYSKGGKSFICLKATRVRDGKLISRIVPALNGVVTTPRTYTMNIVTEFGVAKIKGFPTWGIAENLINIAHPDFRDELIKDAQKMGIWRRTNKIS